MFFNDFFFMFSLFFFCVDQFKIKIQKSKVQSIPQFGRDFIKKNSNKSTTLITSSFDLSSGSKDPPPHITLIIFHSFLLFKEQRNKIWLIYLCMDTQLNVNRKQSENRNLTLSFVWFDLSSLYKYINDYF